MRRGASSERERRPQRSGARRDGRKHRCRAGRGETAQRRSEPKPRRAAPRPGEGGRGPRSTPREPGDTKRCGWSESTARSEAWRRGRPRAPRRGESEAGMPVVGESAPSAGSRGGVGGAGEGKGATGKKKRVRSRARATVRRKGHRERRHTKGPRTARARAGRPASSAPNERFEGRGRGRRCDEEPGEGR